MMKTKTGKIMHMGMATALASAMALVALLLALVGTAKEAKATFPGENGKIAFASNRTSGEGVNNPEGDFEIFTMNPDGTELVQLTQNAAFDFDPEWSPDGQKIAFESDRDLFSDIFVMNADGSGQTNVTNNRAFDRSPTFAPGRRQNSLRQQPEHGRRQPYRGHRDLHRKPRRHGPSAAHEQHGEGSPTGLRAGRQEACLRQRPGLRARACTR